MIPSLAPKYINPIMFDNFHSVLTQFQIAEVHIMHTIERQQINLFEFEISPKFTFNGFESQNTYSYHLKSKIDHLKKNIKEHIVNSNNTHMCINEFTDLRYELKSNRKHLFPTEINEELLNRLKSEVAHEVNDEFIPKLKQKILGFFSIQLRLLDQFIDLIDFFYKKIKKQLNIPHVPVINNSAKKSGNKLQLDLFSENELKSTITWSRDKTEFLELVVALYELNCFQSITNQEIPKYKFIEFMSWVFNVETNNPYRLLNASKNRKLHESSIFNELKQAYVNFNAKN